MNRYTRHITPQPVRNPRTNIDLDLPTDPYIDDTAYLTSSIVDPDFVFDADDTNELDGLTVLEFDTVLDAVRFLNGYAIQ
jgi:hypothetical protein